MALIDCQFFSEVLGISCAMNVLLPEYQEKTRKKKYPVLWLLHGMGREYTGWERLTSIERYARDADIAVVMPTVGAKSWYLNMASGPAYTTFMLEELPRIARSFFPLSSLRKDNFIAGMSMGGYGAFHLAFLKPESFAAAASFSGALDAASMVAKKSREQWTTMHLEAAFGNLDKVAGSKNDLFHLAKTALRSGKTLPKLYACCGAKDRILDQSQAFAKHAEKIGLPLTYEEHPVWEHEWGYWDQQIQNVIKWLPR
ncbi:MAG: alpha/beta hydrolase family protein [Chthoniobacterales bacterium]